MTNNNILKEMRDRSQAVIVALDYANTRSGLELGNFTEYRLAKDNIRLIHALESAWEFLRKNEKEKIIEVLEVKP